MQKICWLGNEYFGAAPGELGAAGFEQVAALRANSRPLASWEEICHSIGFVPDVLVITDDQPHPQALGVESFPCLNLFYSVHSHQSHWQRSYAQAFDACILVQDGHHVAFSGACLPRSRIWWLPPFAQQVGAIPNDPCAGRCLYVDDGLWAPRRAEFLHALGRPVPELRHCTGASQLEIRPGDILVHVGGDQPGLDFGLFEAMAAGACVVSPRVEHGMEKLFVDGEHLVGFAANDPGDAAYRIRFLLDNPELTAHIARAGQQEVASKHTAAQRVWQLMDHLWALAPEASLLVEERQRRGREIRDCLRPLYAHLGREGESPVVREAFQAAAGHISE